MQKFWKFTSFCKICRKPKNNEIIFTNTTNKYKQKTLLQRDNDEGPVNCLSTYRELYNQVYDSTYESDSDDKHITSISGKKATKLELLNGKCLLQLNDLLW